MAEFTMVVAYIVITCIIGLLLTKRSTSVGQLFVAKGDLSTIGLIVLLFGEIVAASSTTGTAQGAFNQGISAIWIFVGKGLGSILFALFFARFYTEAGKAGCMSIPETFKWRFDERVRYVAVLVILVPLMLTCSTQCKAFASILSPLLGLDAHVLIIAVGLLFAILACTGLKGIANMNLLHSGVLFFGIMVAAIFCVVSSGGFHQVVSELPKEYLNPLYPSTLKIGGDFITAALAFTIAVTPTNACFSSVNIRSSQVALAVVGVIISVFALFPVIIGLVGFANFPNVDANSILYIMPESVSPVFSVVVSMAVLAAVLSSAPFLFLSAAIILVRDIAIKVKPNLEEKTQMKMTYAIIFIVAAFAIYFGINTSTLFSQIIGAAHIKATAAMVIIVGMVWKRLTNNAAFWAFLVSGVLAIFFFFSGSVFGLQIEPFWPTCAIEIVLMMVITFVDRNHQFKDYEDYRSRCACAGDELSESI